MMAKNQKNRMKSIQSLFGNIVNSLIAIEIIHLIHLKGTLEWTAAYILAVIVRSLSKR